MDTNHDLALHTAQLLDENGARLDSLPTLVGFDGFIDTILHVVDKRQSATEFTRVETLEGFADAFTSARARRGPFLIEFSI